MTPASETDRLLDYFKARADEDVSVKEAAEGAGLEPKTAATLAARLSGRGQLTRVKRGVYAYVTGGPEPRTLAFVVEELLRGVEGAFGPVVVEELRLRLEDPGSPEALRVIVEDLTERVGEAGRDALLRGVLANLPRADAAAIRRALEP